MFKILLHKRIIVADGLILEAERELNLPIPPCIGLRLYSTEWTPPGCDDNEDIVDQIAWDVRTGRLHCLLPLADYRPERSGSHWAESDIRELFQDWTVRQEMPVLTKPQTNYPTTPRRRRSHGSD